MFKDLVKMFCFKTSKKCVCLLRKCKMKNELANEKFLFAATRWYMKIIFSLNHIYCHFCLPEQTASIWITITVHTYQMNVVFFLFSLPIIIYFRPILGLMLHPSGVYIFVWSMFLNFLSPWKRKIATVTTRTQKVTSHTNLHVYASDRRDVL